MTTEQAIKILNGAIKKPNTIDGYLGQALTMAIEALKNDFEVIRCKDCKFYEFRQGGLPWNHSKKYCNRTASLRMNPDDFCSKGERKL